MKRAIWIACMMSIVASLAIADAQATFRQVDGRVEVQMSDGDWVRAVVGMELETGAMISTGIGSTAVLELGSSVLDIKPLTRMTVDRLISEGGLQTTSLSLRVGKVRADVRTTASVSHDFTIRSPVSTAAVRGTIFSFDGETLVTEAGEVLLGNGVSQAVAVGPNEQAVMRGNSPDWTTQTDAEHGRISDMTPGSGGQGAANRNNERGRGPDWRDDVLGTGSLTIEWRQ